MSAGGRGAVVTTVLTILFVPVFGKHDRVHYKPTSETKQVSVANCSASQKWKPLLQITSSGNPPTSPAPWTRTVTKISGQCVPK